jgi:cysteine desulfuration protein SufE
LADQNGPNQADEKGLDLLKGIGAVLLGKSTDAETMTLIEQQNELISDLNLIEDAHERLSALTSYVSRTKLPDDMKSDELIVSGCISRVWVKGELKDGLTRFYCAADSPMVAGLVALLCDLYSGVTSQEAAEIEPEVWQKCGFLKILTPTRLNGLSAVRGRIKELSLNWC